jgi:ABC-type branched-subunit amino acid transport system substrate-binding protein
VRRQARAFLVAAFALLLILPGCGGDDGGDEGGTVSVFVGVPLTGERAEEGRAVVAGARDAVADADGRAGEFEVRAFYLDDTGGSGRWNMAAAGAVARRAVEDASAVGFIGNLDSGATRISLPITNQAGLVQVSPGSTAPDLTRRVSADLEPGRYRPSEEQTFARLVSAGESVVACSALGYEAMALILDAVAEVGADRAEIVDEVLATKHRRSPIGTYSLTPEGDIRPKDVGFAPCARQAQR